MASTRTGWRQTDELLAFDCGTTRALRRGTLERLTRGYISQDDASAHEVIARYRSAAAAQRAFSRAVAAVRRCTSDGEITRRVTEDRRVAHGDAARLLRVESTPKFDGDPSGHVFGIVRVANVVAVVEIGEQGRGVESGPMCRLIGRAAMLIEDLR